MLETLLTAIQVALIAIALLIGVIVVAFWCLLIYAVWGKARFCRFLDRAAETSPCPACGGFLGPRALSAAGDAIRDAAVEFRQTHPGSKYPSTRHYDAICPACGVRLAYRPKTHRFEPAS